MKSDIDSFSTKIGCNIKELRKDRKMTQQELGNILNISKSTIAHYEQGVNLPPLDILIKLSKCFEVPVDYLLGQCSAKIEYPRLAEKFIDGFTYGDVVNLLYSLPSNAKNHIGYFLNIIKEHSDK